VDSVTAALHAVRAQNGASIAAFLSIVVLPLGAGFLLLRYTRSRPAWQRLALGVSWTVSSLAYAAAAIVFAVCWGGEVGESGKSRLARAYGAPIIEALAAYRAVTHRYPNQLSELVPTYLSGEALRAPEYGPFQYPFEYKPDSLGYELLVRYVGPGMNECRYRPSRPWRCGGYF
jgi:hypothetical protein